MVDRNPTVLLDNLMFPEDPRWRGDKLWFSDVFAKEVITVAPVSYTHLRAHET